MHSQVEVGNASSVLEIFDAISYKKGSSLVRMLKEYLGDEIFQVVEPINFLKYPFNVTISFICF